MAMQPRSIMFTKTTWDRLKRLAHEESLRSGQDVTPSSLVRDAVDQLYGTDKDNEPKGGANTTGSERCFSEHVPTGDFIAPEAPFPDPV
jgi:hypothetical protein